jgi:hypothetical protein
MISRVREKMPMWCCSFTNTLGVTAKVKGVAGKVKGWGCSSPAGVSGNRPNNGGWFALEIKCLDRASSAQEQGAAHNKAGNKGEELIAGGENLEAVHFGSPKEGFNFVPRGWGMCGMLKAMHRACQF